MSKIFGIGLSRTGTTSLNEALRTLGIDSIHWPTTMHEIARYPASTDITVSCRYKELDLMFPNSKFILTARNMQDWLVSVKRHHAKVLGRIMPGMPMGLREFAVEADIRLYGPEPIDFEGSYLKHSEGVLEYFKDRRDDLLVLDIASGCGWDELCRFLRVSPPSCAFPHANAYVSKSALVIDQSQLTDAERAILGIWHGRHESWTSDCEFIGDRSFKQLSSSLLEGKWKLVDDMLVMAWDDYAPEYLVASGPDRFVGDRGTLDRIKALRSYPSN